MSPRRRSGPKKLPASKARSAAAIKADAERYLAEVGRAPTKETTLRPSAAVPPGTTLMTARVYEYTVHGVGGCAHCGEVVAAMRRWTAAETADCLCLCHPAKEALRRHLVTAGKLEDVEAVEFDQSEDAAA